MSIEILNEAGEPGLTFRALSERLATGAGAIYWHVPNKGELLVAACDAVINRAVARSLSSTSPQAIIREVASRVFEAIDAQPWLGPILVRSPDRLPVVRILEIIGQQIRALGIPAESQWSASTALLNYILGSASHNADLAKTITVPGNRAALLETVAAEWAQLDRAEFPFTTSVAQHLGSHDDREDFLTGIDLILKGLDASRRPQSEELEWLKSFTIRIAGSR